MIFRSSALNLGAFAPCDFEVGVGVAAFQDHGQVRRIGLAGKAFGGLDMLRRFDDRDPYGEVLGKPDPGSRRGLGPYRLDG